MADLSPMGFVPEEVEDMGDGFKVLPPGIYTVVIVDSEVKDTASKTGKMLVLQYQVAEGQQQGETLIDRINIKNQSQQAEKIGQSQLKNICDAIGHTGFLKDSEQLHGKAFSAKVSIEKFTSNKSGKELESNKIDKRMPKQTPETHAAKTTTAGNPEPAKKSAW